MHVMGIIFSNEAKLGDLTNNRTMASIPFGGRYRQVDMHLSNMSSAGIRHIGIISRYNYQSLMNHIGSGEEWGLELEEGGLEFLTPFAMSTSANYRGKLENLYSAMNFLENGPEDEYVVMTDAAILSNMDLKKVIANHIASGKDITVVAKSGIANGVKELDLAVKLDDNGEITDLAVDYAAPSSYLASMDTFVLSKHFLIRYVKECCARNLFHMDRHLVLGLWQHHLATLNVYQFDGVALYNDSIEEYFRNSLSLIDTDIRHQMFYGNHPVYTKVRDRVPCYYGDDCSIENCIVADGCMLEGHAKNSVLFRTVTLGEGSEVENCVIMNDAVIGENCVLQNVILDKDVVVRPGSKLIGTPKNPIIIKRGEVV